MSRQTLFRKYVVIFVVLVSGALLTSGVIEIYFSYQENQAALVDLQREKAAGAAARIEQFVVQIERQVSGALPPPEAGPTGVESRRNDFLRLQRQSPAVTEATYLDSRGQTQVFVSRVAINILGSQGDRSYEAPYLAAKSGATYFGPVYFRNDSEPYMTLAIAERGATGGVTVAEVNLKFTWDVVSQIRVGDAGYAYVVDARGQLVAHPDISLVLQRPDLTTLPQVRALRSPREQEPTIALDLQGRQVLTARAAIAPLGWTVFVEQPLEEAFAPLYSSIVRTAVLLVVGLGLSVVASLVLAQRMVRPIQALRTGAARFGAGALDQHIEVRTGDELEALADEFNRMAAQLGESYATLEQKVEERTRDLARAKEQLEAASRHKSEFLASMSHELRTPLNAIIGFSEALAEKLFGDLTPRQERYVQHILDSGRHLLSLISDILDLSKVEAGRMELDVAPFALPEALENGLTMIRDRAGRHGISLSLQVAPTVGVIEADERKVKQVIFNLLSNAVKFTPDGGRVTLTADRVDGHVAVSVRDTGVGIAPQDQTRIFEDFQQVGRSVLTSHEGTGLGLALSRRFIDLHGGRLWVESEVGVGSTFTFTLPLTRHGAAYTADAPADLSHAN